VGDPIDKTATSASGPGFGVENGATGGLVLKPYTPPQGPAAIPLERIMTTVGPVATKSPRPNPSPIVSLSEVSIDTLKQPIATGIVTPIADNAVTADIPTKSENAAIPISAAAAAVVTESGSWLVSTAPPDNNEMRKTSILASDSTLTLPVDSTSQGGNPVKPAEVDVPADYNAPTGRNVVVNPDEAQ
jgi:hypothetical protein